MPGGYNKRVEDLIPKVADVLWCYSNPNAKHCQGVVVHGITIITSAALSFVQYKVDLGNIQGPFFHNKYYMELDHTVMDCLEEQLVIRNKQEYENDCKVHV